MHPLSLDKDKIRIVLLEGIHQRAMAHFHTQGYHNVERLAAAPDAEQLAALLAEAHIVGIRWRSQLNAGQLATAGRLMAIGCFCIGTNQVDLSAAQLRGIPVFNAPFSNTRSVAELVLSEIIMLMRGIPEKNARAHRGEWLKSASNAFEIRGKTLGIIGYGHIGTQLGVMAEMMGMQVVFHDIENKLPLGNARQAASLDALLGQADIVSLHVPQTAQTEGMMGAEQLARIRPGGLLLNASRGNVVDIDALAEALREQRLLGAAVDVFPREPASGKEIFESPLRDFDNVILTPHIGGSTLEAQQNIGLEVATKLVRYSDNGSTLSAVNFPQVALPDHPHLSRILHIHKNEPGMLQQINEVFSNHGINIAAQYLQTHQQLGYVVMDIETEESCFALDKLKQIPGTIRARLLH